MFSMLQIRFRINILAPISAGWPEKVCDTSMDTGNSQNPVERMFADNLAGLKKDKTVR